MVGPRRSLMRSLDFASRPSPRLAFRGAADAEPRLGLAALGARLLRVIPEPLGPIERFSQARGEPVLQRLGERAGLVERGQGPGLVGGEGAVLELALQLALIGPLEVQDRGLDADLRPRPLDL